ncbi:hypothetical protein SELMODRAFT_89701 [Selaginella moellendorffii]|uniref:Exonuclease domain-containing protein n=1 Tax=Selaginella moellendorffii TaxID=88036 RepID=D8RB10_SELML|nr:hypothetical protein SELMODRAFT_89701 [Selaginella moellendorffii]
MEIVFYDLETSMPEGKEQSREILEFGAVVLSAKGLVEVDSYTTPVRPSVMNSRNAAGTSSGALRLLIESMSYCTQAGRIWAGHNICEFDNVRIEEAFASIGRPMPEAAGFIDTLPLLQRTFGQRAGNLKLSTLAAYFSLGKQEHRSLPDVRMNIKVLKRCATVLLLVF